MFREAWGTMASKEEAEFNDFLEVFDISMDRTSSNQNFQILEA